MPRDRAGTFEPVIVKKRRRRLSNLDGGEPGGVGVGRGEQRTDRLPDRAPPGAESWQRSPLTEACSRRICSIAHRQARVVSLARGAATRSSCSTNVVTGQAGSRQIQRRLRQQIRTGRPIAGASTRCTSRRPCQRAAVVAVHSDHA